MPNLASFDTLSRQWALMQYLPRKGPGITARELVEQLRQLGFKVTKRTVERDLQDLSRHFGLICNDKGTPYGWHWMSEESPSILPALGDVSRLMKIRGIIQDLAPEVLLDDIRSNFQEMLDAGNGVAADEPNMQISASQKAALQEWMTDKLVALELLLDYELRVLERTLKGEEPEDFSLRPSHIIWLEQLERGEMPEE